MSGPLLFLARFVAMAGLLFGLWQLVSPLYVALLEPAVNALFNAWSLPVQLQLHGKALVLAYERLDGSMLRLQAHSYEAVYLNIIAATALLAVSPQKGIRWKIRWIGGILLLLWATHVTSFFIGSYIAIWDYINAMPPTRMRGDLMVEFRTHFPVEHKAWYSAILAQWNIWGRYALVVGAWFFALRREIVSWTFGFSHKQIALPLERLYQWRHKSLKKQDSAPKNTRMRRAV